MAEAVSIKDPGAVTFFVSDLCQEADLVYRFGYALTLSEVAAAKLVKDTYRAIVGQISKFLDMPVQEIRIELLRVAWHVFESWQESFKETDSPVLDFLYPLKIEVRTVLTMIDVLGLTILEVQKILDAKALDISQCLAEGRKALLYPSH